MQTEKLDTEGNILNDLYTFRERLNHKARNQISSFQIPGVIGDCLHRGIKEDIESDRNVFS